MPNTLLNCVTASVDAPPVNIKQVIPRELANEDSAEAIEHYLSAGREAGCSRASSKLWNSATPTSAVALAPAHRATHTN
jgi:hypothetical protein